MQLTFRPCCSWLLLQACQKKTQSKTTHAPFHPFKHITVNLHTHSHAYTSLVPSLSPMLRPPPHVSLLLYLPICPSLFLPVSLAVQRGVFKLQVLATNYSGFQFPSINAKVLPYFVTSLYSGEMCSVGLQVNFNHCDTPDLLNAALFFISLTV